MGNDLPQSKARKNSFHIPLPTRECSDEPGWRKVQLPVLPTMRDAEWCPAVCFLLRAQVNSQVPARKVERELAEAAAPSTGPR
jgi:hypothetical protein